LEKAFMAHSDSFRDDLAARSLATTASVVDEAFFFFFFVSNSLFLKPPMPTERGTAYKLTHRRIQMGCLWRGISPPVGTRAPWALSSSPCVPAPPRCPGHSGAPWKSLTSIISGSRPPQLPALMPDLVGEGFGLGDSPRVASRSLVSRKSGWK